MDKKEEIEGNHYKSLTYDAYEIAYENDLDAYQFNAIKYIIRHPFKNGIEDVEKAIKTLERYKKVLEKKESVSVTDVVLQLNEEIRNGK